MKWIIFSLTALILGCSPSRRIAWHIGQLEKLEERHPELFEPVSIDTTIKERALSVKSYINKSIDSSKLERLRKDSAYYKQKADGNEAELNRRGVKDCDSVIKAMKLSNNTQSKISSVHKQSKCIVNSTSLDTLGVHVKIFDKNGSVGVSVQVDSIHIKKDCPPCFAPKQKEYHEFWQFWFWVISAPLICCILLTFVIKLILRRNYR